MDYSDDENNYFRKPNPGMIFFAKKKFDLDLEKSYVIGDRWRDIDAVLPLTVKLFLLIKTTMKNLITNQILELKISNKY